MFAFFLLFFVCSCVMQHLFPVTRIIFLKIFWHQFVSPGHFFRKKSHAPGNGLKISPTWSWNCKLFISIFLLLYCYHLWHFEDHKRIYFVYHYFFVTFVILMGISYFTRFSFFVPRITWWLGFKSNRMQWAWKDENDPIYNWTFGPSEGCGGHLWYFWVTGYPWPCP